MPWFSLLKKFDIWLSWLYWQTEKKQEWSRRTKVQFTQMQKCRGQGGVQEERWLAQTLDIDAAPLLLVVDLA